MKPLTLYSPFFRFINDYLVLQRLFNFMEPYLNMATEGMENNHKLHLKYEEHPEMPQVVRAVYNGKVIATYTLFSEPFVIEKLKYYYMVEFYPTGDTFFYNDFFSCVDSIETNWQYYRAASANM